MRKKQWFQGELTITADMEELEAALFLNQVPGAWAKRAYPSLLPLGAWFADLLMRLRELETWTTDFVVTTLQTSFKYFFDIS
jgi:dynein heavy chain, axonemal